MTPRFTFHILLLFLLAFSGVSRFVREKTNLISDGVDENDDHQERVVDETSAIVELRSLKSTTVTCTPAYGFLPCTTEVWGELFLIVVYEYLLSLAQKYVTQGSELFFKLFGTGIFGASVFQILGTIPQIVILLVNGLAGSTSTAEGLTTMGLAMLAGSTAMSLTIMWGSVIAFGSSDLSQVSTSSSSSQASTTVVASNTSTAQTSTNSGASASSTTQTSTNSGTSASSTIQTSTTTASATSSTTGTTTAFSLTGYGVTTDDDTCFIAKIMLVSMIPFLILQLPQIFDSSTVTDIAIIVAWAFSLLALLVYCIYQVFQPLIQKRRLDYILLKFIRDSLQQSLVQPSGEPNEQAIEALFKKIDKDNNGSISKAELEAMFLGIKIKEVGLTEDDYVKEVMENFDISDDDKISKAEFVKGMSLWLKEADSGSENVINRIPFTPASRTEEEQDLLHPKKQKQKQIKEKKRQKQKTSAKTWLSYLEAAFYIILGTAIMVLLAQPLMEAIEDFSSAVNIPSFIITYIIVPLSMSYRQGIQAITSAKQKTESAISLTFSMIYTSVFMNNMMGLTMFLLIVYVRDLSWDVSAGVLIVLVVGVVMGLLTSFCKKFPFWICILAFLLYPISLVVMYVLITYCGWST